MTDIKDVADVDIEVDQGVGSEYEVHESFDTMGLRKELLKGIYAYGFEKPSAIQKRAIVPLIDKRELIAQAQSGTGKTGAFSIGMLQRIDDKVNETQAIILAPTRELARQIFKVVRDLSQYMDIRVRDAIGGHRYQKFDEKFDEKQEDMSLVPHVLIGTPGRVLDDLTKGKVDNKGIRVFILDEADEMLSKGFQEQIKKIFSFVPQTAQMCLFSATMPLEALNLTQHFMNNPFKILVKTDELTLDGIQQFYVLIEKEQYKYDILCDLYGTIAVTQSIIYCNSKKKVHYLTSKMRDNNFTVSCIHGDMEQEERNSVMEQFRSGNARVLITTDVLSRGIDVQQVSLVINYDLPMEVETYIHRIGRSGRFGRKGVSINFVTNYDWEQMKYIEKFYNTAVKELPANIGSLL